MYLGLFNVKLGNENKRTNVKSACQTSIISLRSAKKMNLESFIFFLVQIHEEKKQGNFL